jgi:glycosyltransferase involved in cell wall biosynthesis
LEWFLKEIFIPFRKLFNNSRLLVVGKNPWDEVKKFCQLEGVELHSDVPDVRPYYNKSGVVVVPILTGGGTRIKVLEAALTGRPILSTPMGAHGLGFHDGKNILFFNDARSFVEKYEALNNNQYYSSITNQAKSRVIQEYSLTVFNEKLDEVFSDLLI